MARTFILKIQTTEDGCYRRLRNTLKTMLRRDKLRCISIEELSDTEKSLQDWHFRQPSAKENSNE
jgi:hypothetical protein